MNQEEMTKEEELQKEAAGAEQEQELEQQEAGEPEEPAEEKETEAGEEASEEPKEKKEKSFLGKKKKKKDPRDEKIDELEDRVRRQMAEFDNFRKRTEKEKSHMYEVGARDVIEKILPVVDNFERGIAASSGDFRPFRKKSGPIP